MKIFLICTLILYLVPPGKGDIVINEILFNPPKDGFDYVEGFNRSENTIDLNSVAIGNGKTSKAITKDSIPLPPGGLFVVTADEQWLRQHYYVPGSAIVYQLASMPSFPDDEGSVILMRTSDSSEIDRVDYHESWHSSLVHDKEGVALERIGYEYPSADKNNWTSASFSSGSGTPGEVNSQFRESGEATSGVSVLPAVFTPDNDGADDFAQLTINAAGPGKVANTIVYDVFGRRVRYLVKNEVLGLNNRFTWDGCDDRLKRLPTGIYLVCTQVFDPDGGVNKFRNVVVLSTLR